MECPPKVRGGTFNPHAARGLAVQIYQCIDATPDLAFTHRMGIGLFVKVKALIIIVHENSIPSPRLDKTGCPKIRVIVFLILNAFECGDEVKNVIGMTLSVFILLIRRYHLIPGAYNLFHIFNETGIVSRSYEWENISHFPKHASSAMHR